VNRALSQRIARSKRRVTERREIQAIKEIMERVKEVLACGPEIEFIPDSPKSAPNIVTFPKPTPRRTH
jgi:hypothetical protein